MSTTFDSPNTGRLGNQIIRNIAVHLIAEKNNLKVVYSNNDLIKSLGIDLFSGSDLHQTTICLNNHNYFTIYNNKLDCNVDANRDFFQTKEIIQLIHHFILKIKGNIIEKNPFKERYNTNNDVFIHVRLDDAAQWNPGLDYYVNTIKKISYDKVFISTDDKNHTIVKELLSQPNATLLEYDEIKTFQFASTCKNVVLSHGSFSAIIGYLSFFSTVYYPEYTKMWHGDIFSIENWIKV
jgi:hypothetical protein